MFKSFKFYLISLSGFLIIGLLCIRCDFVSNDNLTAATPVAINYKGLAYAGSQTCIDCHNTIYSEHTNTAHYSTSQLASKPAILGDFNSENSLQLSAHLSYKMTAEDQLYQSAYLHGELIRKEPFDIILGSGTKGQSYLYWKHNRLYQLPVSYWNTNESWIHSPGYTNDVINFDRSVLPNCLECHTTFAKNQFPKDVNSNRYVKKELLLGVNCESCHGPALKHVNAHRKNPDLNASKYMTAIQKLSAPQQLDACARCHSGLRQPLRPPFTFQAGDALNDFYKRNAIPDKNETLDVHGNQYGLLRSSSCFKNSEAMTCSTCHNPHKNQRDNLNYFSEKCMSCHKNQRLHSFDLSVMTKTNCIDCHMPKLKSSSITYETLGKDGLVIADSLKVRTHQIGIYTDISERIYTHLNN